MEVDAIVNTANPEPIYASGTDSAVYQAAGVDKLLAARKEIGEMEVGQAEITPAFDLNTKYIIHTVGPVWWDGKHGESELVRKCYDNSLQLASKHQCESIAFPLISTGIYGYPKGEALQIAISAISQFLLENEMLVYLVVFDHESFELSGKLFQDVDSYIDNHYVEDKKKIEYDELVDLNVSQPFQYERVECIQSFQRKEPQKSDMDFEIPQQNSFVSARVPSKGRVNSERSLKDVVSQLGETFQERLLRLIDEKGMTDVEVYKKANLSRKLFSKIRCNKDYKPTKKTAVSLAIALNLSLDETKDLLGRAEMALSPSSKFDLIIEYFIGRNVYDVYTINLALFQHEQPTLGE